MPEKVKVGLEIHIQLSGSKLFCACPTESAEEAGMTFGRKLTATTGESGRFDPAAVYEKSRARRFMYRVSDNTCLLEADEEPPHGANREALKKALSVSMALNCRIVDEVSYMRKIVIDGSNTSGFQRTAIVGFNGYVDTSRGRVGISSLCLEEDSARKVSEENGTVLYSLDRLGVPLMEIATDPDIVDEEHAVETAELIGRKVLLAGWARKAPDAIRQDVNFSMGYGRVEIKGVPKLSTIRECLSYEKLRQEWIGEIAEKISGNDWSRIRFRDVTDLFKGTGSKKIARSISEGRKVYGTILPGLAGYLKSDRFRMGRELADVAKLFGSGGIMHSDELPGYGVEKEVPALKQALGPGDGDGFAIIVSTDSVIGLIETAMKERLEKLAGLELSETRVVSEDGSTHYLRPLPGGERMYPETDVQLIPVDAAMLSEAEKSIPRSEEEIVADVISSYGISKQDARVIVLSGRRDDLDRFARTLLNSKLAARLILQAIPELERKLGRHVAVEELIPILSEAGRRKWERQQLEAALEMLLLKNFPVARIVESEDLRPLSLEELAALIREMSGEDGLNSRNIIPRLKSRTSRMFDPAKAIELFSQLKS